MSASSSTAHSVVEPSALTKRIALGAVILYALITMIPLFWIVITSMKSPPDSISYPPKIIFEPTIEGYCNLFTNQTRQTAEYLATLPPPQNDCEVVTRQRNMVIVGPSNFLKRFANSLIIAFGSTALSVLLGTIAAYGF